jgi:hypothetical protein
VRHHIDVGSVLRRSVCDLYSNLVTRPTGEAVRREIEQYLGGLETPCLMVIDFSQVGLLDFSCADEVVGKLLDGVRHAEAGGEAYIILRGARNDHLEAIESAIERYQLAVIVEDEEGSIQVVGRLDDVPLRAWYAVRRLGRVAPSDLAQELDQPPDALTGVLDGLWKLRLVMRDDDGYVSLPSVT